jgi:hypothetical protein
MQRRFNMQKYTSQYTGEQIDEAISQLSQLSEEIADKVSKTGITLEQHTDGLIYIFVDGVPVGNGVELGTIVEGGVIGTLDESNNILLTGALADGTYTLKYEYEDGTVADVGSIVVSSIVAYNITNTLSNCTASGATTIRSGGSATVTISADSGYELPEDITVSGASYAWNKVNGQIVLSNPTSDVQITIIATKQATNLFVVGGEGYIEGGRVNNSGLDRTDAGTGYLSTNYIDIKNGDTVYVKNCEVGISTFRNGGFYTGMKLSDGSIIGFHLDTSEYITNYAVTNGITQFTINKADADFIRMSVRYGSNSINDIIITVNELLS